MKVLIWILSTIVIVLINEGIGMLIGFKLGYVLLFALISAVAGGLCKTLVKDGGKAEKKKLPKGKKGAAIPAAPVPGGWTCPNCGASHDGGTNFCDKCGTAKDAAQSAPAEMTRPQPPAYEMTRPQPIEEPQIAEPAAPAAPVQPIAPVQPVAPVAPVQPVAPVAPVAPVQPVQPQRPAQQPAQYAPYQPQGYQQSQSYHQPQGYPAQQPAPQASSASIKFYVSSMNTEVSVTRASFTVGRDATSDLSLARLPNAKYIARRQASFFCSGGRWYIRDENSTNGTFLNNKQLPGGQPHPLNQGDFISFAGKETLIVQSMSK